MLHNESGPGDLADRFITAFEDVLDAALFYYVGHGQIDMADELCLSLTMSRKEANRRTATGIPFTVVRGALLDSPAATKIVILDCCFSGLASAPASTQAGHRSQVLDMTSGAGAYTMAAAGAYNPAWYETDPDVSEPQTYFTRYLADLVELGIPEEDAVLNLHPLFSHLRENLASDRRPVPCARSIDGAREFAFAYNAAVNETRRSHARRARLDLDLTLRQISHRQDEAEEREQALQGQLAELTRGLRILQHPVGDAKLTVEDQQQPAIAAPSLPVPAAEKLTLAGSRIRTTPRSVA